MATNDFLVFGGGAGANVLAQAAWAALAARTAGFSSGVAQSAQLNKAWRQSSIMAALLGQLIADKSGQNAVDDGTVATLETNLIASIKACATEQVIAALANPGEFKIPCTVAGATRTLIVKWGQASGQSTYTITFPSAFPNACLWTSASTNGLGGSGAAYCEVGTPTATQVQIYTLQSGGAGVSQPQPRAIFWIAIGW